MKKILFNDKYGLTEAVLSGRKTQTRRVIECPKKYCGTDVFGFHAYRRASTNVIEEVCCYDDDERDIDGGQILPKYKVGEIVAIAQSYDIISEEISKDPSQEKALFYCKVMKEHYPKETDPRDKEEIPGWYNKMFVKADLMPHQIRITNVRVERLQDISDKDCLKEGVELNTRQYEADGQKCYCVRGLGHWRAIGTTNYKTPREAYASLIDKISGKGTWESNPYVFVYDFELVK